jgi:uncharacterized protein YheU (UPF0270 family)
VSLNEKVGEVLPRVKEIFGVAVIVFDGAFECVGVEL